MSKQHKNKLTQESSAIVKAQEPQASTKAALLNPPRSVGNLIEGRQPSSNVTPIRPASYQSGGRSSPPAQAKTLIRRRAYELYEKRGREDGHAEEDWLRAEAEIFGTVFRQAQTG